MACIHFRQPSYLGHDFRHGCRPIGFASPVFTGFAFFDWSLDLFHKTNAKQAGFAQEGPF
jgi:hypothetical protein